MFVSKELVFWKKEKKHLEMTEDFGFDGNFYDDEDGKHFVQCSQYEWTFKLSDI